MYFYNKDDYDKIHNAANNIVDNLYLFLIPYLNKSFKINENKRFWQTILHPYLNSMVQYLQHIDWQKIPHNNENHNIDVECYHNYLNYKFNTVKKNNYSLFNSQLYFFSSQKNTKGAFLNKINFFIFKTKKIHKYFLKLILKMILLNILVRGLSVLFLKFFVVSIPEKQFSLKERLIFFIKNKKILLNVSPFDFSSILNDKINKKMRVELIFELKNFLEKNVNIINNDIYKFFYVTVINLPLSYLENFKIITKFNAIIYSNQKSIVCSQVHAEDTFKIYLAKFLSHKNKLFIIQHGAGLQNQYYLTYFLHEIEISDLYLTMGKSNIKNTKRISSFFYIDYNYKKEGNILLINTSYHYYLQHHALPQGKWTEYELSEQINFIKNLSSKNKEHFISRLSPKLTNSPDHIKLYKKNNLYKYTDLNSNFNTLLMNAKLTIHSYLGTTWLQSLSNDIPTILMYNPKYYYLTKKYRELEKKMIKANMLFENGNEASNFVNLNTNNIYEWWQSEEIRKLRTEIKENYCYSKNNFINELYNITK